VRRLSAALLLALLAACDAQETTLPTVAVEARDYRFVVQARGELVASESVPITLPGKVRMGFNIAWLVPEYSEVKQGQVIARFDDEEIRADRIDSELEVVKSDLQLDNARRTAVIDRTRIDHDADRIDGERDISLAFVDVDQRYFSRNELIDALSDLDYLDVAGAYYDWQAMTHEQRAAAEEALILAGRQGYQSKLDKQNAALDLIELRSPADGTFVYATTPWGDKLAKGQRVFAGRPVGLLPVRGKVLARLYVPESDAVGLATGQPVSLRLDSAVERVFAATVSSVSSIASPRTRDDPQKFFVVEAAIDDVDPELMRVGSSLEAEIVTHEILDAFLLPEQAIFFADDAAFVYVVDGGDTEVREVELGRRSPSLVEIVSGIRAGERISVVAPEGGTG
jgi:HlyD family secretion protein